MGGDAATALRREAGQGAHAASKRHGSQQPLVAASGGRPEPPLRVLPCSGLLRVARGCRAHEGIRAPSPSTKRGRRVAAPNPHGSGPAAFRHPDRPGEPLVAQRVEPRRAVRERAARRRAARRAAPAAARGRAAAAAQEEPTVVTRFSLCVLTHLPTLARLAVCPPLARRVGSSEAWRVLHAFAFRGWPSALSRASACSRPTARWCNCTRLQMQLHQRAGSTRVWSESPASLTLASFCPTHRSRTAATSRLGRTAIGPIGTVVVVRGRGSKSQRAQVMTVPCSCAASVTSRRAGRTHRDPAPTQRRSRPR